VAALAAATLLCAGGVPARAEVITEFSFQSTYGVSPTDITAGPDGALWFTLTNAAYASIGRITPDGVFTEFLIPTALSNPRQITAGPDGALWFTEAAGKIGRITTAGVITEFSIPTVDSWPLGGITVGPDGALWFTEGVGNKIGRITTAGTITEFAIPTANSGPGGITAGPDGALWFTEGMVNKIGRITTAGVITEFPIPTVGSGPGGITTGPDGALWFTEYKGGKIGRITTAGDITEFSTPTAGSGPLRITAGPEGALWFTAFGGQVGRIGRITTAGVITELPTPTPNSWPLGIAAGTNGTLWFTEYATNQVARVTTTTTSIAAAVLPLSRSVQGAAGASAVAFAAILNAGAATALNCAPAPPSSPVPGLGAFSYQTTTAANVLTGTPNRPANIAAGAIQNYVFGFSPTAAVAQTSVAMRFLCDNTAPAAETPGVNNFFIVADASPAPDTIALISTVSGDGVVRIPGSGATQLFAIGTSNVGATGTIVVSGDTGGVGLPLTLTVCETTGGPVCLAPPTPTVTVNYTGGTNRSFAFFARASGSIPFDPGTNRVYARLTQAGVLRGATSAAVCTTPNGGC
jgi:virginiamycin B lyase